ncbi:hypothetical protein, partial [Bifidobacterium longum]
MCGQVRQTLPATALALMLQLLASVLAFCHGSPLLDLTGIRIHIPTRSGQITPRIQQTALDIRLHHALAGLDGIVDEVVDRVGGVEDVLREVAGVVQGVGDGVDVCISSSRCFVFSHVFFSGLGSCMHFP